mmetsp:Transcript_11966/g.50360  ORF Transcript_11966/g.50360 Transcript_11966/m.50360 type:complete len:239 (+) Transcript_11966:89-805(+)
MWLERYLFIENMVTDLLGNTLLSSSSTMILRLSLGFWSSCALTYSHTPFTTCVRDISLEPTTAASSGLKTQICLLKPPVPPPPFFFSIFFLGAGPLPFLRRASRAQLRVPPSAPPLSSPSCSSWPSSSATSAPFPLLYASISALLFASSMKRAISSLMRALRSLSSQPKRVSSCLRRLDALVVLRSATASALRSALRSVLSLGGRLAPAGSTGSGLARAHSTTIAAADRSGYPFAGRG